jgi:RHS repeat-associated protein
MEIDDSNGSLRNKYYYANAQILKQDRFSYHVDAVPGIDQWVEVCNDQFQYCIMEYPEAKCHEWYCHMEQQVVDAVPARDVLVPYCYYIHDRLGSVRLVINPAGDVNNTYTYNPFGEDLATECTETAENNFKFTGQWYDSEIGQYYLRARQYDPALMRLTGRDPVKGKFQEPMSLHRYLYCLNNPINATDKTGRMYEFLLGEAILADLRARDAQASINAYNWSKEGISICEAYMNGQIMSGIMMYEQLQGRIVSDIKMDIATSILGWFLPAQAKVVLDVALYEYGVITGDNSFGPDITDPTSWLEDDD